MAPQLNILNFIWNGTSMSSGNKMNEQEQLVRCLIQDYLNKRCPNLHIDYSCSSTSHHHDSRFTQIRQTLWDLSQAYHQSDQLPGIFHRLSASIDELSPNEIYDKMCTLFDALFANDFKWSYLGGILVTAECVVTRRSDQAENVIELCVRYIMDRLWTKIQSNGSWDGLLQAYNGSSSQVLESKIRNSMLTTGLVLGLGTLALMAFR